MVRAGEGQRLIGVACEVPGGGWAVKTRGRFELGAEKPLGGVLARVGVLWLPPSRHISRCRIAKSDRLGLNQAKLRDSLTLIKNHLFSRAENMCRGAIGGEWALLGRTPGSWGQAGRQADVVARDAAGGSPLSRRGRTRGSVHLHFFLLRFSVFSRFGMARPRPMDQARSDACRST